MELVIDSKREMVVLVVCGGVGRVQQPTRVLTLYALLFWEGWGGGGGGGGCVKSVMMK
jgi:hypothetical protein